MSMGTLSSVKRRAHTDACSAKLCLVDRFSFFCFAWNSFGSSFWEPKLGPVLGLGIDNCLRLLQIQGRRVGQKMVPKLVTKKCPRSSVSIHAWCVSRHSKNTAYVHVRSTLSCSPSIAERNVRASVSAACNLNVLRGYVNALGQGRV